MSSHLLEGPRFLRELPADPVQEDLIRVEGSMEGGTWQLDNSVVQQGEEIHDTEDNHHLVDQAQDSLFQIPEGINRRLRTLLVATEANWTRGAVRQLRCRLCPNFVFNSWVAFNKHADTAEAHPSPSKIHYCGHCGDPFGRLDALTRHRNKPPHECQDTSPEKAQEKREVAERELEDFEKRLERFQETDEDIGKTFAQIMKEKYPDSCKKRIGQGRGRLRK
jgi:hypothetical protein